MEVDHEASASGSGAAGGDGGGVVSGLLATQKASMSVFLHPLVLLNVSEHFSRVRAQSGDPNTQVFGALLGSLDGRRMEIFNSFELIVERDPETGSPLIDTEYLQEKTDQFSQVFKTLDLVGWYTTGPTVCAEHVALQRQVLARIEAPVFMLLNPSPKESKRELPVSIFESLIEVGQDDQQSLKFVDMDYGLAAEEAERIGVDHIARVSTTATASNKSEVSSHLMSQYNAVAMLHQRVGIILEYLTSVQDGKFPFDDRLLRAVSGLCSRLPATSGESFNGVLLKDTNDTLLTSYLASITKGCDAANQLLDKLSVVHDRFRRSGARFM